MNESVARVTVGQIEQRVMLREALRDGGSRAGLADAPGGDQARAACADDRQGPLDWQNRHAGPRHLDRQIGFIAVVAVLAG